MAPTSEPKTQPAKNGSLGLTLPYKTDPNPIWDKHMVAAFQAGQEGELEESLAQYRLANSHLPVDINPLLQLARHAEPKTAFNPGMGVGENDLRHIIVHVEHHDREPCPEGVTTMTPGAEGIKNWAARLPTTRMKDELEIVMVVSTGRAGTYGLYKLFKKLDECAYHVMWFSPSIQFRDMIRGDMMECSTTSIDDLLHLYLPCRRAETYDAMMQGKRLIIVNHWDSVFVPFWLGYLGDRAKVIYLERNRRTFLRSFIGKNQWGSNLIGYPWRDAYLPEVIAWYLYWTELLGNACTEIGEGIHLRSEALFDGSGAGRLKEFLGLDTTEKVIADHFAEQRWNEKGRVIEVEKTEETIDMALDAYSKLTETGKL